MTDALDEAVTDVVEVSLDGRRYTWTDVPLGNQVSDQWAHHGIVAPTAGEFVSGSPYGNAFLAVRASDPGAIQPTNSFVLTESHGMSLDYGGVPFSIWVADNGKKETPAAPGEYVVTARPGRVARLSAGGDVLQEILPTELDASVRDWRPTGVVSDNRYGRERVWVTDGYGHSLVHCFDRAGRLLWTIDGSDSGLAFDCPHAIIIDRRLGIPQLLVADRGNRRVVSFTLEGKFIRAFGHDVVTSPSGFALHGDRLWITELYGGLVILDSDDAMVDEYGDRAMPADPGWPNAIRDGRIERPTVRAGVFNSPHGIAIDALGTVAITEWLVGGRLTVLTPIA